MSIDRPDGIDGAKPPDEFGVLLEVAYDGTGFHGWAMQKNARTVEQTLHEAVLAVQPSAGPPRGASRTDAGVHAEGQLAAFDPVAEIPLRGWVLGLNQHLPDDVAVRSARRVPRGYSPRFAAKEKRYRYRLLIDAVRDPLLRARTWRLSPPFDVALFESELSMALGTHDFAAFRAAADERANTTRTISSVVVEKAGREVSVAITGSSFLYNMVRIVVGTAVDVARGRLAPGAVSRALASKNRTDAGITAPAHGLTLEHVTAELPNEPEEAAWPP